nr:putative reductase 1 [Quercus suber]
MADWTKQTFTLNTVSETHCQGLDHQREQSIDSRTQRVPKFPPSVSEHGNQRPTSTALAYGNEHEVGQGIKDSGVPREQIWITTKLDNTWHHRVEEGITSSLKSLDTDYVDLYLVHWPSSTDPDDLKKHLPDWDFLKTWQEMQKLPASGRVKNIGVSNFAIKNLEKLLNDPSTKTVPAVNQIELHPNNPSPKLLAYCKEKNIHATAYSCLGSTNSPLVSDKTLAKIAEKHGKTTAQVLLVWGLQRGSSVIPKSVTASRIEKNFELDGFSLSDEEMKELSSLPDRFKRLGLDQLHPCAVAIVAQQLDPALDPSLAALDLGGVGLEHDVAVGGTGDAVIDFEGGGDADLVGQGGEAGARQPLVEHGGQDAAVHDARVPAQRPAQEHQLHHVRQRLRVRVERQRRHLQLLLAHQRPRRQIVRPHPRGDFHVRPHFAHRGVRA